MSAWEGAVGQSDEWYTPKFIFDAMNVLFDLDPANGAPDCWNVPCIERFAYDALEREWYGFVWLNPPFGGRNGIVPWARKFFDHGDGVMLTPDRTSAPWWQDAAREADLILFTHGKPRFERPDGTVGKQPGHGVTLMAIGDRGIEALCNAADNGLGILMRKDR